MSNAKPMERPLAMRTRIPGYGRIAAVGITGGERYYWLVKANGFDVAVMPWSVVEPLADSSLNNTGARE